METPATPAFTAPPLSPAEYVRSRHAVWTSSSALITDRLGRVLIVRPSYRSDGRWLMPGGGVEAGESPWEGCRREVREEVGLELDAGHCSLLATCWVSPQDREPLPGFPGGVTTVFDGGTLDDEPAARLHRADEEEITEIGFYDSVRAAELLTPLGARIMLAALRARLGGTGPAYLEGGRHVGTPPPLDRHGVLVRPRADRNWPWNPETPVPEGLRVKQAWGWLFVPDGRVLLVFQKHPDVRMRIPMLPGGTLEDYDADPAAALAREAEEEANLSLGEIRTLGWLHDPGDATYGDTESWARMRLAAPITRIGPALPDPATGDTFVRLLATPAQAAELLGSGDHARQQARQAAALATERWGIPATPPCPVEEVPKAGMEW